MTLWQLFTGLFVFPSNISHPPHSNSTECTGEQTRQTSQSTRNISITSETANALETPSWMLCPNMRPYLVKRRIELGIPNPIWPEDTSSENLDPPWTRIPTEVPLSPELRADVKSELLKSYHRDTIEEFRRSSKWYWEESFLKLKGPSLQLDRQQVGTLCNKLTAFYRMPSPEFDGKRLNLLPFRCVFKEWLEYHDNRPNFEFGNFFAHLIRVYSSGPTTVQGIVEAHKRLYVEAASLLDHIKSSEESTGHSGAPWCDPRNYTLKATYRAVIIMMDQYVDPYSPGEDFRKIIYLKEHSEKQTVLLVKTGDDSHLTAPINFEALKEGSLCLPIERTDVSVTNNDVVRVSLTTAVKFITDLQQREHTTFSEPVSKMDEKANAWAESIFEEADVEGIDNHPTTWSAVRRVKAARMGEIFEEQRPAHCERYFR
jgi:hypothetical protein